MQIKIWFVFTQYYLKTIAQKANHCLSSCLLAIMMIANGANSLLMTLQKPDQMANMLHARYVSDSMHTSINLHTHMYTHMYTYTCTVSLSAKLMITCKQLVLDLWMMAVLLPHAWLLYINHGYCVWVLLMIDFKYNLLK